MVKIAVCGVGRETSAIGGEGGLGRETSAIILASGRGYRDVGIRGGGHGDAGHKNGLTTERGNAAKKGMGLTGIGAAEHRNTGHRDALSTK